MNWVANNLDVIGGLFLAHLSLSLPAIVLAVVVAVPLGWLAHRRRRLHGPLLAGIGLLYAIPSLALFILLPSLFGFEIRSYMNIVIVLAIYGVAILVRTCSDAFDAVPASVRQAADACGYSLWKRFWSVDLPLAVPVILAGVRVVVVSTISLVTVGSVIGVRSLGTLFTDGFQRGIVAEVLAGLVLTVVLALLMDALCVLIGRMVAPWANKGTGGRSGSSRRRAKGASAGEGASAGLEAGSGA